MTDHAHELRRYSRKIGHPAGDVPAVMLAAADEIERLRTENAGLVDDMNLLRDNNTALRAKISDLMINVAFLDNLKKSYEELIEELQDERDAMRAKIAEMEQQEPVGEVVHNRESAGLYDILEQGTLLYALPDAQPAPSVPFPDIYVSDTGHAWDAKLNPELWHSPNATPFWAQPAPSIPEGWKEGIEAVASMLQEKADDYAEEYGYDDMGGLSFGGGMGGEIKMDYYNNLIELIEEVEAMLAAAQGDKS